MISPPDLNPVPPGIDMERRRREMMIAEALNRKKPGPIDEGAGMRVGLAAPETGQWPLGLNGDMPKDPRLVLDLPKQAAEQPVDPRVQPNILPPVVREPVPNTPQPGNMGQMNVGQAQPNIMQMIQAQRGQQMANAGNAGMGRRLGGLFGRR